MFLNDNVNNYFQAHKSRTKIKKKLILDIRFLLDETEVGLYELVEYFFENKYKKICFLMFIRTKCTYYNVIFTVIKE